MLDLVLSIVVAVMLVAGEIEFLGFPETEVAGHHAALSVEASRRSSSTSPVS